MVLSISALVMFPLSPYCTRPLVSSAMATSMTPIAAWSCSAALPLKSGLIRSAQLVTGRPTRSGLMPSVSPLVMVGVPVSQSVGVLENFCPVWSQYSTVQGAVPCVAALRPSGYSPLVNSGIVLSQYLNLAMGIGCSVLRPTRYFMKYRLTSAQSIASGVDRNRFSRSPPSDACMVTVKPRSFVACAATPGIAITGVPA